MYEGILSERRTVRISEIRILPLLLMYKIYYIDKVLTFLNFIPCVFD